MTAQTRTSVVLFQPGDRASTWAGALNPCFDTFICADADELEALLAAEFIKVVVARSPIPDALGSLHAAHSQSQWIWMDAAPEFDPGFASVPAQLDGEGLLGLVCSAVRQFDLAREVERLRIELDLRPSNINQALVEQRLAAQARFRWDHGLVCDPAGPMGAILETLRRTAPFDVSVLIQGESGTGKELCARALHQCSLRQTEPWVAVNCAAIPDELLESELFGHRRGAFTHATADHPGLFQQANGGTLFLDEVGEMSLRMQSKLLRVLQEKCLRPVGAVEDVPVDVRVVTASNRDLRTLVAEGGFREDLYFRLATVEISIPPLRQRPVDIPLIAQYLLDKNTERLGKSLKPLSTDVSQALTRCRWPGNVRELENALIRSMIRATSGELLLSDLELVTGRTGDTDSESASETAMTLRDQVDQIESRAISDALSRHKGNKSAAAAELGLSRVGLRSKLERLGLQESRV